MSLAELIEVMTDLSIKELEQKKFGKRRCQKKQTQNQATNKTKTLTETQTKSQNTTRTQATNKTQDTNQSRIQSQTPTGIQNLTSAQSQSAKDALPPPAAELEKMPPLRPKSNNPRYTSQALKHHVWQRDKGSCRKCGSKSNLNFDHLKPVALGGPSTAENLRLLCFHCNQRQRIKTFRNINIRYSHHD